MAFKLGKVGKSKTVVIVEDNLFMAELLAEKFSYRGYNIVNAYNTEEALDKLEKNKSSLVLIDTPLAGDIDIFELIKRIRSSNDKKSLPVICLFNKNNTEGIKKALDLGINTYLIKPDASTENIIEEAEKIIAGKEVKIAPLPSVKLGEKAEKEKEDPGVSGPLGIKIPVPKDEKLSASRVSKVKTEMEKLLKVPDSEVSIIDLVSNLMEYSFLVRASDIHLEPFDDRVIARLRVDGILSDAFSFSKSLHPGIITRIKVLAGMRTDEHQTAQDGRFKFLVGDSDIQFDVRVSIIPTYYGENAVLRLLAEQTKISTLDDLAFTQEDKQKIRRAAQEPYGMILATGPTGSGKSTTLYTVLRELNKREVSIITIEDPVEYSIEGIDQIQVNNRTGLTFANGLRSILRQDPNVIMVGEIRDEETASIAVNAALTGHKLLSTLHTNDAATTLPRLLDMGVEPFLVASTINVAIGQRLVRVLCQFCRQKKILTDAEFKALSEIIPKELLNDHREFYQAKGCDKCSQSGYYDRMGIYEILEIDDFIRDTIIRRADAGEIRKIAIKNGMTTLLEDGFRKAQAGYTTIEEVLRVVRE